MSKSFLTSLVLAGALSGQSATPAGGQAQTHDCPASPVDTSGWLLDRDLAVGIEIKHPADYPMKHWESRSDTSGVELHLWRNAVSRIEFNEFQGFYSRRGPNPSVAPCRLHMRSGVLGLHIERSKSVLPSGRDTLYFIAKGVFTPSGKPAMLVEIGAPDSTGLLEQMAILRTIRFLHDR